MTFRHINPEAMASNPAFSQGVVVEQPRGLLFVGGQNGVDQTHAEATRLRRDVQSMPADVLAELEDGGLLDLYRERPAYQQNDYLGWIGRAKREGARQKRIQQILDELRRGGVYMGMQHRPSTKPAG